MSSPPGPGVRAAPPATEEGPRAAVRPADGDDGLVLGAVIGAEATGAGARRGPQRRPEDLAGHLELALDAGELGTWRWELATGVTVWDERLERLFGLAPGTFDGSFDSYVQRLHPEDAPAVLAEVDRAVAERGGYEVEHRIVRPDGSVRWIQGRGRVTLDDDGAVTGTIGCVADITDRKAAELQAAELARTALESAQRDRRERERLEFLAGLTQAALSAGDHRRFMDAVARAAVPTLGDWCSLHFRPAGVPVPEVSVAHRDPDRVAWAEELAERYPFDPDAPTGVAAVLRTGEAEVVLDITPEVIDDAIERSELEDPDEVRGVLSGLQLTSAITVPLRAGGGVIGAMQFISAESGRRYDDTDVALARAAADRIAEALDALWSNDRHRHVAATLQRALLPAALPEVAGLDVAVRYWPAGDGGVAGDFYDLFDLDDGRVAVVVGDVCGKGAEAAGLTGVARHTIRAAALHGHGPTEVLGWVNDAVLRTDPGRFLTACYATLARSGAGWELEVTVGGHPLPVVVRAGGEVDEVGRPGSLLGAFPDVVLHRCSTTLGPGDTVVLATDGVTDVPPPHGLDRAAAHALYREAAAGSTSAAATADEVHRRLAADLPLAARPDDIALVVLRVRPPATAAAQP